MESQCDYHVKEKTELYSTTSHQRSPVVESQFKSIFNRHLFNHTFFQDYKCMWTIDLFKIHFGLLCGLLQIHVDDGSN